MSRMRTLCCSTIVPMLVSTGSESQRVLQSQTVVFERSWLYQKNAHVCLPWPVWTCLGACLQAPSTHGTAPIEALPDGPFPLF